MTEHSNISNLESNSQKNSNSTMLNSNSENSAIIKYYASVDKMKELEDKIKLRNSLLYGGVHQKEINTNKEDFDNVFSQITESINLLESAKMDSACKNKTNDKKNVQMDFMPFSILQKKSLYGVETKELLPTSDKTESQWEFETQMAEVANNLDSLINSSDTMQHNEPKKYIKAKISPLNMEKSCYENKHDIKPEKFSNIPLNRIVIDTKNMSENKENQFKEFVGDSQDTELYNMAAIYDRNEIPPEMKNITANLKGFISPNKNNFISKSITVVSKNICTFGGNTNQDYKFSSESNVRDGSKHVMRNSENSALNVDITINNINIKTASDVEENFNIINDRDINYYEDDDEPPTSPILCSQIVKNKSLLPTTSTYVTYNNKSSAKKLFSEIRESETKKNPINLISSLKIPEQNVDCIGLQNSNSHLKNVDNEDLTKSQSFPNDLFEDFMIANSNTIVSDCSISNDEDGNENDNKKCEIIKCNSDSKIITNHFAMKTIDEAGFSLKASGKVNTFEALKRSKSDNDSIKTLNNALMTADVFNNSIVKCAKRKIDDTNSPTCNDSNDSPTVSPKKCKIFEDSLKKTPIKSIINDYTNKLNDLQIEFVSSDSNDSINSKIDEKLINTPNKPENRTLINNQNNSNILEFANINYTEDHTNIINSVSERNKPRNIGETINFQKTYGMNCDKLLEVNTSENVKTKSFQGFFTASNKNVKVSEEALKNSNRIFQDIDSLNPNELIITSDQCKNMDNVKAESIPSKSSVVIAEDVSKRNFQGFFTANNKNVKVSEEALKKSNHIFQDIDSLNPNELIITSDQCKNMDNIKAESIPSKSSVVIAEDVSKRSFQGFFTASNKNVKVSEEALKKSNRIFQDIDSLNPNELIITSDQCKNMDNVKAESIPSKSSVVIAEDVSKRSFQGFFTASNKNVKVSEEALKKGNRIFQDIDSLNPNELIITSDQGKNMDNVKAESIPSKSSVVIAEDVSKRSFQGFFTASNKNVKVSEEALKKSNRIFQDIDSLNPEEIIITSDQCKNMDNVKAESIPSNLNVRENVVIAEHFSKDSFQGFLTANNKNVKVSEEALKKTKNIFQDIDQCNNEEYVNVLQSAQLKSNLEENINFADNDNKKCFEGFTTGNNKNIKVSEEALDKCKNMFNDFDMPSNKNITILQKKNMETSNGKQNTKLKLETIIDTQEISEIAEAFLADENEIENIDSPQNDSDDKLDIPSSPILQFKVNPRKRKSFKPPYINDNNTITTESDHKVKRIKLSEINSVDSDPQAKFIRNYKVEELNLGQLYKEKAVRGNRTITLNEMKKLNDKYPRDKNLEILEFSHDNFMSYQFKGFRLNLKLDIDKDSVSIDEVINIFETHQALNKKLIPDGWILNHIKWIMWKLASYERNFPNLSRVNPFLTLSNVLKQLKYRYDRELYHTQRPILRKILEKDDVSGKRMVLCVSRIITVNPDLISADVENSMSNKKPKSKHELELTDGWYAITAVIDSVLSAAITSGKIVIGTKLIICGAELLNCSQGVSPLEDISAVRLKIWANSCRRCKPFLKLGLYKWNSGPLPLKLSSCTIGGGPIPILRCVLITLYPTLYLNKSADGSISMRSDKLQQIQNAKYEAELQIKVEQLYGLVEKEYIDAEVKKSKKIYGKMVVPNDNDSPEKLANILESIDDPQEFYNSLTTSQRNAIQKFTSDLHMKTRQNIDQRVKELMNEQGLIKEEAVKVIKCRIISQDGNVTKSAILTIWRPDDAITDVMREGACLEITNITPTGIRSGELQISAGRRSTFLEIPLNKHLSKFPNLCDFRRTCLQLQSLYSLDFSPKFNEVDVVGIVIGIEPKNLNSSSDNNSNKMQTVYIADENMNIAGINFWGGINKFGYSKVIEENRCLACANLQYRPRTISRRIRQLYTTELSTFTQCPKKPHLGNALKNLESHLSKLDIKNHLKECVEKLRILQSGSKQHLFTNIPGDKSVMDVDSSALNENKTSNMNDIASSSMLNNASNISTFLTTKINISSVLDENMISANSSRVEAKINKLKMYGDAPPLSPIILKSSKKLKKDFVMPVFNKSNDECQVDTSIVKDSGAESHTVQSDVFAEEFNYSPPMSFE